MAERNENELDISNICKGAAPEFSGAKWLS